MMLRSSSPLGRQNRGNHDLAAEALKRAPLQGEFGGALFQN